MPGKRGGFSARQTHVMRLSQRKSVVDEFRCWWDVQKAAARRPCYFARERQKGVSFRRLAKRAEGLPLVEMITRETLSRFTKPYRGTPTVSLLVRKFVRERVCERNSVSPHEEQSG